ADLRNQRGSDGVKLQGRLNLLCPLKEERHGSIVSERLVVEQVLWIRQGQRLDDKLAFSPHTKGLPARHQQLQARTGSQQVAKASARRVLPTPPVPVKVSKRTSGRASRVQAAASSRSRPMSEVSGKGRVEVDRLTISEAAPPSASCLSAPIEGRRACSGGGS